MCVIHIHHVTMFHIKINIIQEKYYGVFVERLTMHRYCKKINHLLFFEPHYNALKKRILVIQRQFQFLGITRIS